MSTFQPELCCVGSNVNFNCDFSNPGFSKDVYPPAYHNTPAIVYSTASIIFLLFILTASKNIFKLYRKKRGNRCSSISHYEYLLLFASFFRFGFSIDGPLQLIGYPGLPATAAAIFEAFSIAFMNMNFGYSSYIWIHLVLLFKLKWGRNTLTNIIQGLFIADAAMLLLTTLFTVIDYAVDFVMGASISWVFYSVISLINGITFAISCYTIGINLAIIYDFDSRKGKRVKLLKLLAIIIGICSLVRSVNDLASYIAPNWQVDANIESYCARTFLWSAYEITFFLFADIFPIALFFIVFSPETKQRTKQSFSKSIEVNLELLYEKSETLGNTTGSGPETI